MLRNERPLLGLLIAGGLGIGCGAQGVLGAGEPDPTDPALYSTPPGEVLAFGVKDGNIRNYFRRQGPAAVHLLARSGANPRLIAAFPANNQGIGVWFLDADPETQLWSGEAGDADLAGGGAVA